MSPQQHRTAETTPEPPPTAGGEESDLLEARVQVQMSRRLLARLVEHPACTGEAGHALLVELVDIHRAASHQLPQDLVWGGDR
jgi:hypothetical protein